jgi:hypothetical protein
MNRPGRTTVLDDCRSAGVRTRLALAFQSDDRSTIDGHLSRIHGSMGRSGGDRLSASVYIVCVRNNGLFGMCLDASQVT